VSGVLGSDFDFIERDWHDDFYNLGKNMAQGELWSREETILAMNLYCRIPFGRQHSRTPEIMELAKALGRTPGSVAMKLNNITSIDPEEQARGVKGLHRASKMDRIIWAEFHTNWEKMAAESEYLWQQIVAQHKPIGNDSITANITVELEKIDLTGPTEATRTTKIRLAQSFFRQTVLSAYLGRCCVSGIPMPELLIASHIMPWSDFPDQRINPCNGLCMSRLHDAAFDRGLIAFDENYRLVLSTRLKDHLPNESLNANFVAYEGNELRLPEKFHPDKTFLTHHREHIFCG
jgi:predicted restriction endonuclease